MVPITYQIYTSLDGQVWVSQMLVTDERGCPSDRNDTVGIVRTGVEIQRTWEELNNAGPTPKWPHVKIAISI